MSDLAKLRAAVKPNTRMIWVETPTNPTLKLLDIQAICAVAKEHNLIAVSDNTFASPFLQSPLLLGASISYNSMTKYIGGHSDVVGGSLTTNDKELFDKIFFIAMCKCPLTQPPEAVSVLLTRSCSFGDSRPCPCVSTSARRPLCRWR